MSARMRAIKGRRSAVSRYATRSLGSSVSSTTEKPWCVSVTSRTIQRAGSVLDLHEVEPVRGCGRAGLMPLAAVEERRDLLRLELEHGADERPHHVTQVAVGRDLEVEMVAATDPVGALDRAREDGVLRVARRERAEVVPARQERRGVLEPRFVELARDPPAPVLLERRACAPVEDPVAVAPRARGVPRVEVRRR